MPKHTKVMVLEFARLYDASCLKFYQFNKKIKIKKAGKIKETTEKFDWPQRSNSSGDALEFSNQHDPPELPIFELSSMLLATDNFNLKNKLGQGGFGSVYKVDKFCSYKFFLHNFNYI